MEQLNEYTNYPVSIAQLNVSLIVTSLVGVKFSQVCPQHDEHITVQTRPVLRELHLPTAPGKPLDNHNW